MSDETLHTEIRIELGTSEQPRLIRWSSWWEQPNWRQAHHAYALMVPEGVLFVDPEQVAPGVEDTWLGLLGRMGGPVIATALTSSWHERWAYGARERFNAPVWLPALGQADAEGHPDHLYDGQTCLPGGLLPVPAGDPPGGDTALLWRTPDGTRLLFSGDLVMGCSGEPWRAPSHWRYAPGMYVWMHAPAAPDAFRARARRLLAEPFDLIYPGHGEPVPFRDHPYDTLARVVASGRFGRPSLGAGLCPADAPTDGGAAAQPAR